MAIEDLNGKVAIVTGGTRGIGYAVAERLLGEGARVAVCGSREETVSAAIQRLGGLGEVFGRVADISKFESVRQFVQAVLERYGSISILVNNAGIGTFASVGALAPEDFDKMIALNLSGAYYCSHEVLPIFNQQGGGDIVNIGSLAGKNPFAGGSGYNASKFGLNGFSEAMMLDHRNDGVRVCQVMPGSVATGFGGRPPETGAEWKIAPEDVAEAVVGFLRMPRRTTVSRIEIRPSRPPGRA